MNIFQTDYQIHLKSLSLQKKKRERFCFQLSEDLIGLPILTYIGITTVSLCNQGGHSLERKVRLHCQRNTVSVLWFAVFFHPKSCKALYKCEIAPQKSYAMKTPFAFLVKKKEKKNHTHDFLISAS